LSRGERLEKALFAEREKAGSAWDSVGACSVIFEIDAHLSMAGEGIEDVIMTVREIELELVVLRCVGELRFPMGTHLKGEVIGRTLEVMSEEHPKNTASPQISYFITGEIV
jgi:hypothetical protein